MNQNFKDKLNENPSKGGSDDPHYKTFESVGHVRNLCLTWPDGKRKFMNYAYLVSGEYSPEEGRIILIFTSETIVLVGIRLNLLFNDLLSHLPLDIVMIEQRYSSTVKNNEFAVHQIEVSK
jgi:hypothetical protein